MHSTVTLLCVLTVRRFSNFSFFERPALKLIGKLFQNHDGLRPCIIARPFVSKHPEYEKTHSRPNWACSLGCLYTRRAGVIITTFATSIRFRRAALSTSCFELVWAFLWHSKILSVHRNTILDFTKKLSDFYFFMPWISTKVAWMIMMKA